MSRRPSSPVALEIQACRVVEDRRQRLRQQGLRDLQRPAADRLDPPVVEHVHAAVDVVQVQRQLAMGVEFANRGALGQRPGDPGQHELLDDAVGARPARPEQAVPAEKVVDGAEGLPDPDDDPALLAAVGQVGPERRGIAGRAPGLLEEIDEFLRREQAVREPSTSRISSMTRRARPSSCSSWAALVAVPTWRSTRWRTLPPLRTDLTTWTLTRSPGSFFLRTNMGG